MNFNESLLAWHEAYGRQLPWRETKNPYYIWLSEIILQQTRVEQGLPYYLKFCEYFPDVERLAAADEEQVLKTWQGLGYYSRARNLHKAAKLIVDKYNGKFPEDIDELLSLPGVGQYTAAAIASFAFGKKEPAIDGNFKRVFSRIWGITAPMDDSKVLKKLYAGIKKIMPSAGPDAGKFNGAVMDLGATICLPANPKCPQCPVSPFCEARKKGLTEKIPAKAHKTKVKTIYQYYIIADNGRSIIMEPRPARGIWAGLYTPPFTESNKELPIIEVLNGFLNPDESPSPKIISEWKATHLLTHRRIEAHFIYLRAKKFAFINQSSIFDLRKRELENYPVPKLIENAFKNFNLAYVN